MSREVQSVKNPNVLEGTLAYISPEQTGRINRAIDYRTDLYSAGVTFYRMLTGELPFATRDPMELVYAHLAKQPVPPVKLDPSLPEVVSSIVMKLLSKDAEDRYKSAFGLRVDLEKCLQRFEATGRVESFPLAARDVSDRFQIPQKLYGREQEIAALESVFARVSEGARELVLVAGASGIGKSAVICEIHLPR